MIFNNLYGSTIFLRQQACFYLHFLLFTKTLNMADSEVSSKSSKKSKLNKNLKAMAHIIKKEDKSSLIRKQQELMRVLHIKNYQLQSGNLTYLDYIELKDELIRLNALKDMFNSLDVIN